MELHNINGTSDKTCACGSWLNHWRNFSRQTIPVYCPATSCVEKAEVGAFVQENGSTDMSWYIVPLCKKHNAKIGKSIDVSDYTTLV